MSGRRTPWVPHSGVQPCSLTRAGFFNETICLAFPLMGHLSPLSLPPSVFHNPTPSRPALREAMAGLASCLHVYSSHLATSGLSAESLTPSAHPRCGTAVGSSWLCRYHVAAHTCSGCWGLCSRGAGTASRSGLACAGSRYRASLVLGSPCGPGGDHRVRLLSLREGGPCLTATARPYRN